MNGHSILTNEDISDVLKRAEEISAEASALVPSDPSLAAFAQAAEEAGLAREAVAMALRERLLQTRSLYKQGDIVLARSTDGYFYPAIITETVEGVTKVRFLQGGEANLEASSLTPFSAMPGAKFQFEYPYFGWTTGSLTGYNPDSRSATMSYWGTQITVPLEKVRLKAPHEGRGLGEQAVFWSVLALTSFGSLIAGAALTYLLTR